MTEISETTAEEASVPSVQGEEVAGHTPGLGHMHTAIMETIREDLERQHPDLFTEDSDGEVVIPSGCTPQTAYVKIDISALAEVAMAAGIADSDLLEALKIARRYVADLPIVGDADLAIVNAAISRATGGSQ